MQDDRLNSASALPEDLPPPLPVLSPRRRYWLRVRSLTTWSLGIGFVFTLLAIYFARPLSQLTVFGWPVSFYMAGQGLILLYLAILVYYAIAMREYDKILKGGGARGE